MIPYQTHSSLLKGSDWQEILAKARHIFRKIQLRSRRKTYLRSAYFNKEKVFFDYFWIHFSQKNRKIRTKRLKYFSAAIELIEHGRHEPISKENPNGSGEILHRFYGLTRESQLFCVQIKETKRTGAKYLMSIFPPG